MKRKYISISLLFLILLGIGNERLAFAQIGEGMGPGIIQTIAGSSSTAGFAGDGGLATEALLNKPRGLVMDGAGSMYIADTDNHRIRKVDAATGVISTYAGNGTVGYSGDGESATEAQLNKPIRLAVYDSALYFVESGNHVIRKVDMVTGVISTVAGTNIEGFSVDGTLAIEAMLSKPYDLKITSDGVIYFSELGNKRIRKIDPDSGELVTVVGNGETGDPSVGTQALSSPLDDVYGFEVADNGDVYFAPFESTRLFKVDVATGTVVMVFFGVNDPMDLVMDSRGKFIFIDSYRHQLRGIDPAAGTRYNITRANSAGFTGDGLYAVFYARFNHPHDITLDKEGNIYVADRNNNRIRKIKARLPHELSFAEIPKTMQYGDTLELKASSTAENLQVKFRSSDYSKVSFIGNSPIIQKAGEVDITAYAESYTYDFEGITQTIKILKDTLTVSVGDIVKPYGRPVEVDLTYEGFVYADSAELLTAEPTFSTTATDTSAVGTTHDIILSGGISDKYVFKYVNGTLTVEQGILNISADSLTIDYGTEVPELSINYEGLASSESPEEVLANLPTISTSVSGMTDAGTYDIVLQGGSTTSDNYDITYTNGTLTVNKKSLIVKPYNIVREIGETNGALYFYYDGFIEGEGILDLTSEPIAVTEADETSAPGWYEITMEGGEADNYAFDLRAGYILVNPGTGQIMTIAGGGEVEEIPENGISANEVKLSGLRDVAVHPLTNDIYFGSGHTILKVNATTGYIHRVAGDPSGEYGYSGDGSSALNALLFNPEYLTFDLDGNLYFSHRFVIRRIDNTTNKITTVAGTNVFGSSPDGTLATEADLHRPHGLAIDKQGNLYFAENYAHKVRKIDAETGRLVTVAGNGTSGGGGDGGLATEAQFRGIFDIALDTAGNLYISDRHIYHIRKVDAKTGIVTAVTGNGIAGGTGGWGFEHDPEGYQAMDIYGGRSYGIAIDSFNNLYYSDEINKRIIKVNAQNGFVTRLAGQESNGFSGDGGYARNAAFNTPYGLTLDSQGDMYFVDAGNNRIRKIGKRKTHQLNQREDKQLTYGDPGFALDFTSDAGEAVEVQIKNSDERILGIQRDRAVINKTGEVQLVAYSVNDTLDLAIAQQQVTISKRPLLILKADSLYKAFGDKNPALIISSDTLTSKLLIPRLKRDITIRTEAYTSSNPGVYEISLSGPASTKYIDTIVYNNGALTIEKKQLYLTVSDSLNFTYGDQLEFDAEYDGFVGGYNISTLNPQPELTVEGGQYPDAGVYQVQLAEEVTSEYYDLVLDSLYVTIGKAPLTIQADSVVRAYGDENPQQLPVTYTGFKLEETEADLIRKPELSLETDKTSPVGQYLIGVSGAESNNYNISYTDGMLDIQKAPLEVLAGEYIITVGDSVPEFTITYNGFKNGEDESVLDVKPQLDYEPVQDPSIGSYPISFIEGSDDNYSLNHMEGALIVERIMSSSDQLYESVKAYPNPTFDVLKVQLKQPAQLTLTNMEGKVVMDSYSSQKIVNLNVEQLESAIYILTVNDGNAIQKFRLIKS